LEKLKNENRNVVLINDRTVAQTLVSSSKSPILGFDACILDENGMKNKLAAFKKGLRFKVGDEVACKMSDDKWQTGKVGEI